MAAFRSKFEQQIANWFKQRNINAEYEPCKIGYTIPASYHTYTPDWSLNQRNIYYEAKGKLDVATRQKMTHIKNSNPGLTFRIIFQNPSVKIRKNAKMTYGEWATKMGFEWCDFRKGIPKQWLKNG